MTEDSYFVHSFKIRSPHWRGWRNLQRLDPSAPPCQYWRRLWKAAGNNEQQHISISALDGYVDEDARSPALPNSMRLFEAMAEAPNSSEQQYLVLAEYELLYDWLCSSSDKIYREAVLLRGNAGMGLSIFRSYLLYRRLLDGKPTAFLARGGQLFLFHEHGVAFYSLAQSSSPPLAWCKIGVWIIVDFDGPAGYSEELSLAIGGGKLVYPASHAGYHLWRRWVNKLHRRGTAEWMRPWSIADLQYRYNADFWVLIRRSCRPAMRSVVYCIASNRATSSSISGTSDQSLEMSSAIKLHTKAALRR